MEYSFGHEKNTSDKKSAGSSRTTKLSLASQSARLQDRFEQENSVLSYADLHHEITNNENTHALQKSTGNRPMKMLGVKGYQELEFVKNMSKLPSYLERGETLQEKVLNVGVLEWGRLEKWQSSSKHMAKTNRSGRDFASSSNTSSSSLADGSYLHTSTCQRMRRPSLQFHLMASPIEGYTQVPKSFQESAGNLQNLKERTTYQTEKLIIPDQPSQRKHPEIKLEQCQRKGAESSKDPENGTLLNEVISPRKGKKKSQVGEFPTSAGKLQEQISPSAVQNVFQRDKMVVLLLPRDRRHNNQSEALQLPESTTISGQVLEKASRRSSSERSKDLYHGKLDSCVPRSCPHVCEFESNRQSKTYTCEGESIDVPSPYRSRSPSGKVDMNPYMHQNLEVKGMTLMSTKSTANEPSGGSDVNASKLAAEKVKSTSPFRRLSLSMGGSDVNISKPSAEKVRSTSPFRRFSISMGKIVKSSRSGERSGQPLSGLEKATASACLDGSSIGKSSSTSSAKSSPLRRLLDPLLKQKPVNCRRIPEPLLDDASMDRHCKSFSKSFDSSNVPSRIKKVDMETCGAIRVNASSQDEAKGSTTVQALFRVAVKNGQPLFTFAVDKDGDIFAATVSKLCPLKKSDCSRTYTFFSIREVKKKSGFWKNKGAKGKGREYVPNVVAQMKAFDSQFSNLSGQEFVDHLCMREFVLFSVNLKQADHQASDLQPKDELAAIVVKISTITNRNSVIFGCHRNNHHDMSENELTEFQEGRHSYSGEMVQSRPDVSVQGITSVTVILPSGSHTLPSNGGPSSLIQRWKSGGLCDCGGWDLGCKLNILANPYQSGKKLNSSRSCSTPTDTFELFPQVGGKDNRPVFSLSPFEDRIYSVEFNSSVSVMQAFSICIAVVGSGKVSDVTGLSNEFDDKSHEETESIEKSAAMAPTQTEAGEAPARYVSYPPLSPVGRV